MKKLSKQEKRILRDKLLALVSTQFSIPAKDRGLHFTSFLKNFETYIEEVRQKAYEQAQADALKFPIKYHFND